MEIKTLQIFTDYVCPWCYLGQARLKKVISKYKINSEIIHFPLHPDTPKGGRNLLDLFGCSQKELNQKNSICLLYTSPSPRDQLTSRMPSSA